MSLSPLWRFPGMATDWPTSSARRATDPRSGPSTGCFCNHPGPTGRPSRCRSSLVSRSRALRSDFPRKMRALTLTGVGGLEHLRVQELPEPAIESSGDVLVRLHAFALNRLDLF